MGLKLTSLGMQAPKTTWQPSQCSEDASGSWTTCAVQELCDREGSSGTQLNKGTHNVDLNSNYILCTRMKYYD